MTAQHELDRTLGAWFGAEAAPAPPPEQLLSILETTRRRRPRPSLLAGVGSHWVGESAPSFPGGMANLRPALSIALVALLAVALVGAALLVGSRLLAPHPLPILHTYVNEFVASPALPTPMSSPILVQLVDGRVLVIGSRGGGGEISTTALLYDVRTGHWVSAGPMVSADGLAVSAAVLLRDGRVLVVGDARGFDGTSFAFGQLFDPATMQFEPTGPITAARWSVGLASLPDGRVLVTGDRVEPNASHATAELFDPATSTFSAAGSIGASTVSSMATLPDGRVFIVGDELMTDEEGSWVVTTEIFDPRTAAFGAAGTVPFGAAPGRTLPFGVGLTAIALPDGRVALIGGSSLGNMTGAAVWDPTSQTLSPRYGGPEWVFGATLLADGRIFMTGDRESASWAGIYNPTTSAVTEIKAPAAWRPSSILLADGRVLLVGGLDDGQHGGSRSPPAVPTVQIFQ